MTKERQRIGIFAGTFDPVHTGHITFALQALEQAQLDEVMFVPERRPRHKTSPEHFGHRVAMLRRALKPHGRLSLLELVEARLSVYRTLPHLRAIVPDSDLVLLVGSDVIPMLPEWPSVARLLKQTELVVGVRAGESPEAVRLRVATWPVQPRRLIVFESFAPEVSAGKIRRALQRGQATAGLLTSVWRYSRENWLYATLSAQA